MNTVTHKFLQQLYLQRIIGFTAVLVGRGKTIGWGIESSAVHSTALAEVMEKYQV